MNTIYNFPVMTAEEAAELVPDGAKIALGGFTPAGSPKAVPEAIALRAQELHAQGKSYKLDVLTGASVSSSIDDKLAAADAVRWRAPYQTSRLMRQSINADKVEFVDMHLSEISQMVDYGFLGEIDVAVIEASAIDNRGRVCLTTGIGCAPTFARRAKKVIIELNSYHSPRLAEITDIAFIKPPPNRYPIPIYHPLDKIGIGHVEIPPERIAAIVETNRPDEVGAFGDCGEVATRIAANFVQFMLNEIAAGRVPRNFLPLQSGVGNINNAVLKALGDNEDFPAFCMFSEVLQDSAVELMERERITGVSASSLTIMPETLQHVYNNFDYFSHRIVLRPQELSNNPELVRRLGVIALNVALEMDIYGNVNSTHLFGSSIMNGIGGSGDFERNSYLSVFMSPSTAKNGAISAIVPMCTHVDHSEHSVKVIVTEHGVADLRGLSPRSKAETIINNCAAPEYRDYLMRYITSSRGGHIGQHLDNAFELHLNYLKSGKMLP
ncbi:succinate CoA transferase [Lentisphaerota bacterium ZTH]|nr:succinate CoA transferase [Lentisphaerota bacterium]WET07433.1 succinate CoA transferase [Lentisphaerota bacterium ZTH]